MSILYLPSTLQSFRKWFPVEVWMTTNSVSGVLFGKVAITFFRAWIRLWVARTYIISDVIYLCRSLDVAVKNIHKRLQAFFTSDIATIFLATPHHTLRRNFIICAFRRATPSLTVATTTSSFGGISRRVHLLSVDSCMATASKFRSTELLVRTRNQAQFSLIKSCLRKTASLLPISLECLQYLS